jgi:hypothetical protein
VEQAGRAMTRRPPLRLASTPTEIEAAAASRPSWRVKRVAATLDCDGHTVRDLVRAGQLEAHGIGKRGLRIFADSVRAYQERMRKPGKGRAATATQASPVTTTASYKEAIAHLRKLGVRNV